MPTPIDKPGRPTATLATPDEPSHPLPQPHPTSPTYSVRPISTSPHQPTPVPNDLPPLPYFFPLPTCLTRQPRPRHSAPLLTTHCVPRPHPTSQCNSVRSSPALTRLSSPVHAAPDFSTQPDPPRPNPDNLVLPSPCLTTQPVPPAPHLTSRASPIPFDLPSRACPNRCDEPSLPHVRTRLPSARQRASAHARSDSPPRFQPCSAPTSLPLPSSSPRRLPQPRHAHPTHTLRPADPPRALSAPTSQPIVNPGQPFIFDCPGHALSALAASTTHPSAGPLGPYLTSRPVFRPHHTRRAVPTPVFPHISFDQPTRPTPHATSRFVPPRASPFLTSPRTTTLARLPFPDFPSPAASSPR